MHMLNIAGKLYRFASLDELTLEDLLRFEIETAQLGVPTTVGEIRAARDEMAALDDVELAERHPKAVISAALTVWAAMRAAGEDVTFRDALQVKNDDVSLVAEPEDRAPKAKKPKSSRASTASDPADDDEPQN